VHVGFAAAEAIVDALDELLQHVPVVFGRVRNRGKFPGKFLIEPPS